MAKTLQNQTNINILEGLKSNFATLKHDDDDQWKSQKDIFLGLTIEPKTITYLEEVRDKALNAKWYIRENLNGTKDLIRDCTNISSFGRETEVEEISYQIQAVNTFIAAQKVLELEEKSSRDGLVELMKNIKCSINAEAIKDFNALSVHMLKSADVNDAKDKLMTARDFISMECQQFHVTTITKLKNNEVDKILVEMDIMLLGLTDLQKSHYVCVADNDSDGCGLPKWYTDLSEFDQKIVKHYANKISEGNVMLPTQSRRYLPGLRNAYEKSVFVADPNGENMVQVLSVLHSGTPSFHGKGNRAAETKKNLQQLKTFAGGNKNVNVNPLNSPHLFGVIPNFTNDDDMDAPGLIKNAQKELGGSTTVTPLNALRRFTQNDNSGFIKALKEIGKHLKDSNYFQKVSYYLIHGENKKAGEILLNKLSKLEKSKSLDVENGVEIISKELIQSLQNVIRAKELIMEPAAFTESENQNLELVSLMCLIDFTCNNENGSLKKFLPGLDTERLNVHCASGKDRTGIALTLATNQAVSQYLGLTQAQAETSLIRQISGRHNQLLTSLNGGTPGCHGVKSDSKTALSDKNPLNALIEKPARYNKFKTSKTWRETANNVAFDISALSSHSDSFSSNHTCWHSSLTE